MNINTNIGLALRASFVVALFCMVSIPSPTVAATPKLSCELTTHTNIGTTTIQGKGEVLLQKGDAIEITWKGIHATKATDARGDTISLSGTKTISPKKNTTYTYRFSNGSKRITCAVNITIVTGSFASSSLLTNSFKPTISGKVSGIRAVQIQIFKEGSTTVFYTSKIISVKKGAWKAVVTKKLPNGRYTVNLLGVKNRALNAVVSGTLIVGKDTKREEKSLSTLVVQSVPLLLGGVAHGGKSVSVAYLQVINIGKTPATIQGFTVTQAGSASVDAVTGFTIVDDSESLGGSTGGTEGETPFKDTSAFVPLEAVFAPGQMRLFTIKAMLTNNVSSHVGKQLKINVTGVDTSASVRGTFPIRGTVWTIGI